MIYIKIVEYLYKAQRATSPLAATLRSWRTIANLKMSAESAAPLHPFTPSPLLPFSLRMIWT
jgi:hypothetical protein